MLFFTSGWSHTCTHTHTHTHTHRDVLIEQLMREIVDLKEKISELEGQRKADQELLRGLRERLLQVEAELTDYKDIAEQTCNVCIT